MRNWISETPDKVGQTVELAGWVDVRRDHGKLIFIDLRDKSGVIQLVFTPKSPAYEAANKLRDEWVIRVKGEIKARPENMVKADALTGKIELPVTELEILSEAKTPPLPIKDDGHDIGEDTRLKYRYLDLRRPRLQRNIKIRSEFVDRVRQFLFSKGFTEIETPYFTSTTPEGSRDFVVPSRMYPGSFFALPQSPQQYKQLLMVAGFERYFQIARCFRDEDLRADRGFEHTQIDLEMSFVTRDEVMALDEELTTTVCEAMGYKIKEKPFPRISYAEAMKKYGADKFDMRTEEERLNPDGSPKEKPLLAFAWVIDFPFFERVKDALNPSAKSALGSALDPSGDGSGSSDKPRWTFTHNPFSMPASEHLEWHMKGENFEKIVTQQYDLVCNGYETGGGSIRAHKPEILKATFKTMGYDDARIEKEFGHMLEAFSYGVPPHGGIAHGIERLIMILTGEQWLREVQAFPQTSTGHTAVMDAPTPLSKDQLKELGITIEKKKTKG